MACNFFHGLLTDCNRKNSGGMSTQEEFVRVEQELEKIGTQIEALLERQETLLQRKSELLRFLEEESKKTETTDWNASDFPWTRKVESVMKKVFKIDSFRPVQRSAINLTMAGKDCILIMPTGGGKSLCYQLPALVDSGVTLVVSPLVSLMEDQLFALSELGVDARMLNAAASRQTVNEVHAAMLDDKSSMKLLYVTPEKLAKSKRFMAKLEKMYQKGRFARLAVDEVHCCSNWGHDFRPDYKILGIMKRQFPKVPILGLTATCTATVTKDVQKILNIRSCPVLKAPFNRPNLYYEVRTKPDSFKESVQEIAHLIKSKYRNQSGIVYCFTRKESEDISKQLSTLGISAACYHADLPPDYRSKVHKSWVTNAVKVVVATIAFGMGIDKADVRFVIHHSLSKSIENFYQESGRAGRDEENSDCILFYRFPDFFRQSTMVFTENTGLTNLYNMADYCMNPATCRRSLIAKYFGESWNKDLCRKMCDHCRNPVTTKQMDITAYCCHLYSILDWTVSTELRVTAAKLLDIWLKKASKKERVESVPVPKFSREMCGHIVFHLLKTDYLREDFHFTPYSTISYILPGPNAAVINQDDGSQRIFMDIRAEKMPDPQMHRCAENKGLKRLSSNEPETNAKAAKKSRPKHENNDLAIVKRATKTKNCRTISPRQLYTDNSEAANASTIKCNSQKSSPSSGKSEGRGDGLTSAVNKGAKTKQNSSRIIVIDSDSDSSSEDFQSQS